MTAPLGSSLDLQATMVAAMKSNADLTELIGDPPRIFQRPREGKWPGSYIRIGPTTVVDASNQCGVADNVYPTLDIWSREPGFDDAKRIAAVLRAVFHRADLLLTENRCFSILHDHTTELIDPDGITFHIQIVFRARIELRG